MRRALFAAAIVAALIVTVSPNPASAFCGFYVAGADADLVNKATMVVMMRDQSRTVLSMQNNYEGPPEDFAMVVPVPVVLQEDNVKVLDNGVFQRVDHLAAPRLVEYWEQDPCYVPPPMDDRLRLPMATAQAEAAPEESGAGDYGVTIEAEFTVGEYDIVILSAEEANGLDRWLRDNGYNIPEGAEPVLRPYIESGMKFFVAKVDTEKVRFEDGRAMLSPLRFHYDSEQFSLPVRLGLLNSSGTQDLIVHILAMNQRYELANYENVTIPTNIDVADEVRTRFGEFYAALFDETMSRNPRAIVTEYAWQATNCDPCPGPVLSQNDLATLGADVLPSLENMPEDQPWQRMGQMNSFVLDAPAHALRPRCPQRRPGVSRGAGDRRRPRDAHGSRGPARARLEPGEREQLPGALRNSPRVDRAHRMREPRPGSLGRPAREHAPPGDASGDGSGVRAARQPPASAGGSLRRSRARPRGCGGGHWNGSCGNRRRDADRHHIVFVRGRLCGL